MRKFNLLRIAAAAVICSTVLAFGNLQPGKDKKEDKGQGQKSDKGKEKESKETGIDNNLKNKSNKGDKSPGNKSKTKGELSHKESNGKSEKNNGGQKSNSNWLKNANGKRDVELNWNLNDFENRKHPKNQKKVSVCHKPSPDSKNSVTLSVSENALKAHLNHGDYLGNCKMVNSNPWSKNYVKSRENVYNTYEQTWERVSYSEALIRLAAEKLFGIRTNLEQSRSTLSMQEVQRRESLILDLQNNVNALNQQVGSTKQQLSSDVNIIISL